MRTTMICLISILFGVSASLPEKGIVVTGTVVAHKPYCGGAKPTAEMLQGTDEAMANATYYLKTKLNHHKRRQTIAVILTDANGKFQCKVKKPGTYYLVEEGKIGSFEAFKQKYNQPRQHLEYVGDEQAKTAYEKADAIIEVKGNTTLTVKLSAACFTGLNPCLKYTGPMPQ